MSVEGLERAGGEQALARGIGDKGRPTHGKKRLGVETGDVSNTHIADPCDPLMQTGELAGTLAPALFRMHSRALSMSSAISSLSALT